MFDQSNTHRTFAYYVFTEIQNPHEMQKLQFSFSQDLFQQRNQENNMFDKTEIHRTVVYVFAEIQNPNRCSKYNFPSAGVYFSRETYGNIFGKTEIHRQFVYYVSAEIQNPQQILEISVSLSWQILAEQPTEKHRGITEEC